VGDNDNLSARIAALIDADWLVLLTDQDGLYDRDPRIHPDAKLIPTVKMIDESIWALAGGSGTPLGTGGMVTKIQAAQLATRSGTRTIIAQGRAPDVLIRLVNGEPLGTHFLPLVSHLESRKRWLLAEKPQGILQIDEGASQALKNRGASLLHVGIKSIQGEFERGAVVLIEDGTSQPIAQGLTNYNSAELLQLQGHHSSAIIETLGYTYGDVAVHRDNLVLIRSTD
jgi:glutamate 5-kinase